MTISNIIGKVRTHSFTNASRLKEVLDYMRNLENSDINNYCVDSLSHGYSGLINGSKTAICFIPKNLII